MSRVIASAVLALTLSACASNSTQPAAPGRDAAHANVQLGVAYMQQGQLALAKEKLERAAKQDPRSAEVHSALAYLNERLDRPDAADAEYRLALRLSPNNSEVGNNYAVFLCRNGKVDTALKQFDLAARDRLYTTPWAALTNAGVCLRSANRGGEAVRLLEQAIALRPQYTPAVFELADLQLELGSPGVAGLVVDRYLALGLTAPDVLLLGVRAALARDERPAAQTLARRLRREFANSEQAKSLTALLGDGVSTRE
jgi:type IV pilus assembly protein PilF